MSEQPHIVVVGAGPAGLEFLLSLHELAPERADVEVIAPEPAFTYRPLSVIEVFETGPTHSLALEEIATDAGARYRQDRVVAVDSRARSVRLGAGRLVRYDELVLACGARPATAVAGALHFRGAPDEESLRRLLDELADGLVRSVGFVVPPGPTWPLPAYELALLTARHAKEAGLTGVRIALVTTEALPLAQFGGEASRAAAELLETAGVELHCGSYVERFRAGALGLVPDGEIEVERVVAVPRLRGPRLAGIPFDQDGFIPTGPDGNVHGAEHVLAAGDATSFPLKQGGLAVQQAAAAAETVAARLGAAIEPQPFEPVLQGLLVTGGEPRYLGAWVSGGHGDTSVAALEPLWWPPSKIAGGRLASYLRDRGLPLPNAPADPTAAIDVQMRRAG